MYIDSFPAGALETNCYLIGAADSAETLIIDPGQESAGGIATRLQRSGRTPVAVLLTHGHLDHTWDLPQVCEQFGLPAYIHAADRFMLTDPAAGLSPEFAAVIGNYHPPEPAVVHEVVDGQLLRLAGIELHLAHVPGHSPGSIAYRHSPDGGPEVIFGGDVLFHEGVGRTDLPGGSRQQVEQSIADHFFTRPDDTVVYPGHGPSTTIEHERHHNPFLSLSSAYRGYPG